MFANPNFTRKTAPVFCDSALFEGEGKILVSGLRPSIMNDDDNPPKALIELDMFLIPVEDFKTDKWKKYFYDLTGSICLTPDDTIRLIRHLNGLLKALFDDYNYIQKR